MDQTLVTAPYRDPARSIADRVEDLLARMTLAEKLAQLGGVMPTDILDGAVLNEAKAGELLANGIGHISRICGMTMLHAPDVARLANQMQRFLVERTRLGIPAISHEESLAGLQVRDATCFPQAIGLASMWSPELIERMTAVIRRQMRAVGARQSLSPVLDIARDPRWGRTEETYGEDPHLAGRIGAAYVRGLQGELRTGVAATAKHFIGYGLSEGGLNWAPAHIGEREMLEVFAEPFAAAIEAGLASVMNAYHELDGVPCGASREVLEELLRETLGFTGVVVSDYFTVPMLLHYHRLTTEKPEAASRAIEAGLDVELPSLNYYGQPLREAIDDGRVPIEVVDRAVRRSLRLKFELGLFEEPYVDEDTVAATFDTPEDRALALEIAQKSIVLLQNDGLLPLERPLGTIAVIGPHANSRRLLQGDYHYPTHLEVMLGSIDESRNDGLAACFPRMITLLERLTACAPSGTRVVHAQGCAVNDDDTSDIAEAVELARGADVVILAVGGKSGLVDGCTSGESCDRSTLGLPGVQQHLVDAVLDAGKPTVVVLLNGAPLAIPEVAARANAIVEAWCPGEEGGNAIADVLFGTVNPGGRLPVTVPRSVGQVPLFYNHKPSGGRSQWRTNYTDAPVTPLWPFGHGLSYTTFEYGEVDVSPTAKAGQPVTASVEVTNSGHRSGDEVVQLYIRDMAASVTRPVKQLVGFQRITLAAGETRKVRFEIAARQMAFYDVHMDLVVEPGQFEVMAGASSEDLRTRTTFEATGQTFVIRKAGD